MTLQEHVAAIRELAPRAARPLTFMEVCGTHTMTAFRSGLRSLLPPSIHLLSGPGCPVCVTPSSYVDKAVAIAQQPDTVVATFGDLVRVPGTEMSLETARAARAAAVRIVYSPLDALQLAQQQLKTTVVFLGVGFETTAPAIGWTIREAARRGLGNYAVLCAHKTMPQAMSALLRSGEICVDGFLCPGHVSIIIGARAYEFICRDHRIPCVVAGFEAADMAAAIAMLVRQRLAGEAKVEVEYSRSVTMDGNASAQALLADVFEPCDAAWRGLGVIPGSGLRIRQAYAQFDAELRFANLNLPRAAEPHGCRCGEILRGVSTPAECPLFRRRCTPSTPVGACMVSSEGTCAAHFRYANPAGASERVVRGNAPGAA